MAEEPTLGPLGLPHFLVKQLHPEKHGLNEADLATAIQEIEIETQIYGASFLKVHVIDPEWKIITSGLIKANEDGLLNELEVEFPERSGYHWQLCAVEGSTEISMANLILTFEDRIVARLREQWGHLTAKVGTTTRAQFVKQLVEQANLREKLHPRIKFVSPGINRVEPIEASATEKKERALKTPAAESKAEAERLKARGVHAGAELTVGGEAIGQTQREEANVLLKVAEELGAGQTATEALIYAAIGETRIGKVKSTSSAGAKGTLQSLHAPYDTLSQAKHFLLGEGDFHAGGAIKRSREISNPKQIAVEVEVPSIWPANSYETQAGGTKFLTEAQQIIHAGGGSSAGGSKHHIPESDVKQLSRGTATNPDEDSWDCITRLAQQVNWSAFTDGKDTLFYMDGPDFVAQRPVCYVNPSYRLPTGDVTSHIVKEDSEGRKVEEFGALIRPLSFTYDNTAFLYGATHKVKGRLQRKSKISKPQTPSEIRMQMLCGLTEFHAGQVFVFRHCGPISENGGRWIVADATRESMKYPYTKFILVPPTEPLPEPQAEATTNAAEVGGALGAFEAANTLSQMQLPYLWGGGHQPNGLKEVKAGGPGLDCSGAVCWVLWKAGMFKSSTAEDSTALESFGEAGEGKEMTVWASSTHTYIEFNIPGHETAQLNTNVASPPGPGPRLVTLSQGKSFNGTKGSGSSGPFTSRHFKGT